MLQNSDPTQLCPLGQSSLVTVAGTRTPHIKQQSQEAVKLQKLWSHHFRLGLYECICPYLKLLLKGVDIPVVMGKKDLKFPTNLITIPKADFHKGSLSFMKTFFTGFLRSNKLKFSTDVKKNKTSQCAGVRKNGEWKDRSIARIPSKLFLILFMLHLFHGAKLLLKVPTK